MPDFTDLGRQLGPLGAEFDDETIDLARDTMKSQLRDLVLDELIHGRKNTLPWNLWSELEQQAMINRVERSVGEAIKKAVVILVSDGNRTVRATIESVTVKDGLKIVANATRNEANLVTIGMNVGDEVLLTVADLSAYEGGQERKPEALQPDMFPDDEGGKGEGPVFDDCTPSADK